MNNWYGFSDQYSTLTDSELCLEMNKCEDQHKEWLIPYVTRKHIHDKAGAFYGVTKYDGSHYCVVFYRKINTENMGDAERIISALRNTGIPARSKTLERALCEAWLIFCQQR